jgi:hypothetical protein
VAVSCYWERKYCLGSSINFSCNKKWACVGVQMSNATKEGLFTRWKIMVDLISVGTFETLMQIYKNV